MDVAVYVQSAIVLDLKQFKLSLITSKFDLMDTIWTCDSAVMKHSVGTGCDSEVVRNAHVKKTYVDRRNRSVFKKITNICTRKST